MASDYLGLPSGSQTISNMTAEVMHSSAGVDGQIIYNTTYRHHFKYINDRWTPLGAPDPRYGFAIVDEFTGAIASSPWTAFGVVNNAPGTATNYGMWNITQSSANAVSGITQTYETMLLGLQDYYFEAIFNLKDLATATEDYCLTVGLNDVISFSANGAATDGVYFQYDRAVTGSFWGTRTANNSTITSNTSAIPVEANKTYRLGFLISGSSSVKFYVNGVQTAVAHTTNIPSTAGRTTGVTVKVDKKAGTTPSHIDIDTIAIYGFFVSPRTP